MSNKDICGAKTRQGTPCQRRPAEGRERCSLHGGHQKRGTDHHSYKHGLYSKYAGDSLKDVIADLDEMDSEELISPEHEIKLMQALIVKCEGLKNGSDDLNELDTISKIIERLIHAKQRSQKIMLEQERLIPAGDVKIFLNYTEDVLQRYTDESNLIMDELQSFRISDHEN